MFWEGKKAKRDRKVHQPVLWVGSHWGGWEAGSHQLV